MSVMTFPDFFRNELSPASVEGLAYSEKRHDTLLPRSASRKEGGAHLAKTIRPKKGGSI